MVGYPFACMSLRNFCRALSSVGVIGYILQLRALGAPSFSLIA
jgi:hypothetical protein